MEFEYEPLPVHPYTGLTAIGVLPSGRPVWPVIGAASDDDSGDDGEGDSGDADDSTDDGDVDSEPADDGWTPPTKAEWDALEAKRKRANRESARRREQVTTLNTELEKLRAAQAAAGTDAEAQKTAAQLAAVQEKADAASKRAEAAMRAAAKRAILSAGYAGQPEGKVIGRLVSGLNYAELDVDDDGEIVGLDEQIDDIKAELSDLFRSAEPDKPKRTPPPRVDTGDKKPPAVEETYEKKLARQMGLIR